MLFNSMEFLLFYLLVVSLYFLLPARSRWMLLLLAGSYYFYMSWNPAYLLLLMLSTLIDYCTGLMMVRHAEQRKRRLWLILSLVSNLSILFFFKYYNFFNNSVEWAAGWFSIGLDLRDSQYLLPVGISFYTFQSLSYSVDVYRGDLKPEKHPGYFALYVSYFPQLVAGPIERASTLLSQFRQNHVLNYEQATSGLRLAAWGLFKKVVIADRLATLVNAVYGNPEAYTGLDYTLATLFFAVQIYCDFSGYSDIALGTSRVLGIELMQNFRRPYLADSVTDFWRRWHISLSTWFKDYLYVPLGGNRVSIPRWYFNLLVTFLISGLWHGASWTFVCWGALHGLYMVAGHLLSRPRAVFSEVTGLNRWPRLLRLLNVTRTFALVCLAWVFFRANSMSDAIHMLSHLGTGWSQLLDLSLFQKQYLKRFDVTPNDFYLSLLLIGVLELVHQLQERWNQEDLLGAVPSWQRWPAYYALVLSIFLLGVFHNAEFIYFQF